MREPEENRLVEFERLNLVGKAVFLGGSAIRLAAGLIDSAVHHAADVYVEAERSFKQGLDPNIEDATILYENDSRDNRSESGSQRSENTTEKP